MEVAEQATLNGVAVSVTPEIRFFSSDFGGMLDIGFVNKEDLDPIPGLAFMGRAFSHPPHLHCVVPDGCISPDHTVWISSGDASCYR